jgi:uncharacterized DUF497 family protein
MRISYELQGISFEWDQAAAGYTEGEQLLFVVHVIRHEEIIRLISAREATRDERRQYENP